uniref:Cocoonase 4 n=1 Tax=Heliconius aoede TaxID=33457 RepID=A0A3G2LYM8_9NEOP|nr:cocoonase 4 [Heliconius aoede]
MKIFFVLMLLGAFLYKDAFSRKTIRYRPESNNNRIVGGYNVSIEEFPYQVHLLISRDGEFFECGGSIISNKTILTAAHCLAGASSVYVRLGATSSSDEGETIASNKLTQHPKYSKKTYDYDIGIVTLDNPIKLDGVKTKIVRLTDKDTQVKPGQNVIVSGWGATSENGDGSDSLLAVDVPIVSNDECRKVYRSLTIRMFCAGVPQGGKDACQGDSGGPAVIKSDGIQVGVVSHGIGCARKGYPGVYISVASVRDWIKQVSGV